MAEPDRLAQIRARAAVDQHVAEQIGCDPQQANVIPQASKDRLWLLEQLDELTVELMGLTQQLDEHDGCDGA